jgi:hypothetical protein
MRRFIYYLPTTAGPADLHAAGLLDRFASRSGRLLQHTVSPAHAGPGGEAGGHFVAIGPAAVVSGEQQWSPIFSAANDAIVARVAIEALPPGPSDLARSADDGLGGYTLTLGDGNTWTVPLVHKWNADAGGHDLHGRAVTLAPVLGQDNRTQIRRVAKKEFAPIDALAARTFTRFATGATISISDLFADAVAFLAVNYRIGPAEAGLLGLLDEDTARTVLGLAIDYPALLRHAQATARSGPAFDPGNAATSPAASAAGGG